MNRGGRLSERPPPPSSSSKNAPALTRNADRDLYDNLVEMLPLVESFLDPRANPSFKRRASMAYTPAPKVIDPKAKKDAQPVSARKQRDCGDDISHGHARNQDGATDNFSISSSRALRDEDVQNDVEELTMLREQLDDLHRTLSEKDDALRSAEELMNQMSTVYVTFDELKRNVAEKELLVTSTNSQLSNAEIKLVERQAALEKLEKEAKTSSRKVEELQEDIESMDFEKFALMLLFQELSKNDSSANLEENITSFQHNDHLPHIDEIDDAEMNQMEEARVAYIAAVAVAKENPCDESLAAATKAFCGSGSVCGFSLPPAIRAMQRVKRLDKTETMI